MYNLNYKKDVGQADPQDQMENKIRELIKANKNITRKEIGEKIGVSEATIKRHIKNMNDIEYVGSGYSGHWEIIK